MREHSRRQIDIFDPLYRDKIRDAVWLTVVDTSLRSYNRFSAGAQLRDIRRTATGAGHDFSQLKASFVPNENSGNRQRIRQAA
jgi:hypothetical protein